MMKKLVFVIQLIFLYSSLAMADPVISLKTLLHEMTDRSALARWPENTYTCKQFSSYDRSSHNMTDKRAWFGNFDQGQFIRQEENGGRTEYVMMDAEGPGAMVRFWMTFSGINRGQGTLRIYIDNEEKPVIEGNVRDILSGQVLCGEPLSTSVPDEAPMEERGHNLYLPIPYAKRCKVTIESPDLKITPEGKIESKTIVYYAINYRTYISPVKVVSFSAKELKKNARLIAAVNKKLSEGAPGIDTPLAGGESTLNLAASLAPGESRSFTIDGSRAIRRLSMRIDADDRRQALRSTVLSIAFDGELTVWAPVGEFAQDLTFADLKGRGVYVGDAVTVYNPNLGWWGEGDEKVYVDGETFPSHFGTGTEDYYGYAWGRYEPWINHPFVAQPIGDGCYAHIGLAQNTRVRSLDAIPFTRSLRFDMELFDWSNIHLNYAPITFWYMLPGGEIQPKPFVSDVRERVANQPSDIFGSGMSLVVEGEVMQPRPGHMGSVELQTNFHPLWSEGMQLYWKEFKSGDKLSLVFDSEVEGTYYAKIQFTVAPDYGTFALRVNDKVITPEVSLTNGEVSLLLVNLGRVNLEKGKNELQIESIALAPGHDTGFFGIDKLTLRK
ncbi:DUF2961 domain-containing protein [Bacteroides sp. AF18-33]|uniref:DUF2961 domain-containing protein n=1 Tax=Bacteroides sp. AF18-33 TaxID=2292920 RepID=UPI000E762A14|nr:DUF2961 domain-containing protein [Bacteroides sp. AF18-33]RJV50479.1 DUF2961 domain-containing protein [Bacteroides sp. AF18-33]